MSVKLRSVMWNGRSLLQNLKTKAGRTFAFWQQFYLMQRRAQNAEKEARYARGLLAETETRLKAVEQRLLTKQRDPLAEAQALLALADDLLSHSPAIQGELRGWRVEYLAYRQYHQRSRGGEHPAYPELFP